MVIALATSSKYENGYRDSLILTNAFQDLGHEANLVVWDAPDVDWSTFDCVLIHTPWDYTDKFYKFSSWCKLVSKQTLLVNELKLILFNRTKSYLLHLQAHGVTIPPTQIIKKGSGFKDANSDEFNNLQVVVKPVIDASGKRAHKFNSYKEAVKNKETIRLSQECDLLLQPFQDTIYEGEYSVIFINGEPSHCVLKRPSSGEFRVQEEHGGFTSAVKLTDNIKNYCTSVLKALPILPIYLRIDFINISSPVLMEVEMIEPDLFLRYSETAATILAKAVISRYVKNAVIIK